MFNWFLSTKKEKKITSVSSEENTTDDHLYIPQPPLANYEIAHQIRETIYDPCYYCHPDELNDEISDAFENRMLRQIYSQREHAQKEELLQVKNERMRQEQELLQNEVKRTAVLMEEAIQKMKDIAEVEELIYSLDTVTPLKSFDQPETIEPETIEPEIQELETSESQESEDYQIEVIDWDAKLDEWGVPNSYAFVDSNYLNEINWTANPTFQYSEETRTNDLMKFLEDEVSHLDDLLEVIVDKGMPVEAKTEVHAEAKTEVHAEAKTEVHAEAKTEVHAEAKTEVHAEAKTEVHAETKTEVTIEDINRISEQLSNWNEEVESDYKNKSGIEESHMTDNTEKIEKVHNTKKINQNEKTHCSMLKSEHPEGYLEINMGPMFSGKSTKSLFKLTSMADQRFPCLYVNSNKDIRKSESADNMVSTHNSSYSKTSPKITCVKVSNLSEVRVANFDYIAVDELQFFDDAYETILSWLNMGKYVIVASLDGDCYRRKFGRVLDLIPHANEVTKLTAYCDICRDNYKILNRAPFTARMTSDTSAELVGGSDLYKAMCRNCHDFHLDVTVAHL